MCAILNDREFVESYIRLNRKRISAAYTHVITELKRSGIEHVPGANAAFFVWVNLGKMYAENLAARLEATSLEGDGAGGDGEVGVTAKVHERLLARKVFLVDGDAAGAEEPGWFRLVFTQPPELVSEAISRIAEALNG